MPFNIIYILNTSPFQTFYYRRHFALLCFQKQDVLTLDKQIQSTMSAQKTVWAQRSSVRRKVKLASKQKPVGAYYTLKYMDIYIHIYYKGTRHTQSTGRLKDELTKGWERY